MTGTTRLSADGDVAHGIDTRHRDGAVLVLVCACQFMAILDAAIVNVALPSIRHDLGFSSTGLAWVVNGYLLTLGGLMLVGGRAADLFGQRRMLTIGLSLFSVSSLAAGLATTPGTLVGARLAQGAGAALFAPAAVAVINTRFLEPGARARAFGAWSAAGGVGGMAGALVGGALTTGLSWRWVFLLNVPIGLALLVVASRVLGGTRARPRGSLDLLGAFLGTAGLAAVGYGVMQSATRGWWSVSTLAPGLAGLLLLAAFFVVERQAAQPMMPLRLFRVRGVAAGNAMLLLFGAVPVVMWYFTSLLLQNAMGNSALRAGLGQTPAAVAFVVVARVAAGLLPRWGPHRLLALGGALLAAGFGLLARTSTGSDYGVAVLGPTLLVAGGIGLVFPTLMAAATHGVPERDAGSGAGLASTAVQVGGSLGLAVLATVAGSGGRAADLAAACDRVFVCAAVLGLVLAVAGAALRRNVPG